jgi:hypothetical protein
MSTLKWSSLAPVAIVAVATLSSAAARAEYRCAKADILSSWEVRACELARRDTPDALIHFVNRTQGIFGLYANDYVSVADVQRWESAKDQEAATPSVATARSIKAESKVQ